MDAASKRPCECLLRALSQAEGEIDILSRIPAQIIAELAALKTSAHAAFGGTQHRGTGKYSGAAIGHIADVVRAIACPDRRGVAICVSAFMVPQP